MQKQYLIIFLAISLVLNLLLGIALVILIPRQSAAELPDESTAAPTQETSAPTEETEPVPSTAAPTEPPATEPPVTQPPATQPPVTQPPATNPPATQPPEEYIGSLYTRKQLEKLDNTLITYGPGTAKDGNPAPYAGPAQDKYGKYDAWFIAPDKNVIYLTFDCGYEFFIKDENGNDVALTGMILDTLKEKNVKAVFFVTMSYVQRNPDLVQRMIDEGHDVASHSVDHYSMPSLTIDEMVAQIMELHDYMEDHFGYTMHLFRPPAGEFSIRSLAVTQSMGYKTVHWSFAYADWDTANQPDPDAALSKILSSHHSGAIYLLHAVSETNARILGEVIDGLQAKGYRLELFR